MQNWVTFNSHTASPFHGAQAALWRYDGQEEGRRWVSMSLIKHHKIASQHQQQRTISLCVRVVTSRFRSSHRSHFTFHSIELLNHPNMIRLPTKISLMTKIWGLRLLIGTFYHTFYMLTNAAVSPFSCTIKLCEIRKNPQNIIAIKYNFIALNFIGHRVAGLVYNLLFIRYFMYHGTCGFSLISNLINQMTAKSLIKQTETCRKFISRYVWSVTCTELGEHF